MEKDIYNAPRGEEFKQFIRKFALDGINFEFIDILMSDYSLDIFNQVFTSRSANEKLNYEMFEQLGDVSVNKFVVNYMYKKFPQLRNSEGVDVVAKLKMRWASKENLQFIADRLGMWNFITASIEERSRKRKKLLEDVFESIIGAIEFIIDEHFEKNNSSPNLSFIGVGYNVVYLILTKIFNTLNISIKYEDLVDAKTRINEVLANEKIEYESDMDPITKKHTTKLFLIRNNNKELIGRGEAVLKKDAQEKASKEGLKYLEQKYDLVKETPERFRIFNNIQK